MSICRPPHRPARRSVLRHAALTGADQPFWWLAAGSASAFRDLELSDSGCGRTVTSGRSCAAMSTSMTGRG